MEVQSFAENLLFTTVRIEIYSSNNVGVGTGFIFLYSRDQRGQASFIVTNKHVLLGADTIKFFFLESDGEKPILGKPFPFHIDEISHITFYHPNPDIDIAIVPLSPLLKTKEKEKPEVKPFLTGIEDKLIPEKEDIYDFDALEDIVFVGYPYGIYDEKNLLPVIRRGITATPVYVDYNNKPVFLIDASVFPGSSGSPVFIINKGSFSPKTGGTIFSDRIAFLGVIAKVFFREESGNIEFSEIPTFIQPTFKMKYMLNLGVVYKAHTVIEAVEDCLSKI